MDGHYGLKANIRVIRDSRNHLDWRSEEGGGGGVIHQLSHINGPQGESL